MGYDNYIDFNKIIKKAKELKIDPIKEQDHNSCKFLNLSDLKTNINVSN